MWEFSMVRWEENPAQEICLGQKNRYEYAYEWHMHWHPMKNICRKLRRANAPSRNLIQTQRVILSSYCFTKNWETMEAKWKDPCLVHHIHPPVQASACLELWRSTPFAVLLFCSVVMEAAFTLVLSQETHYCLSAACGGRWLDSACPGSPLTSNQSSLARAALTKIEQPFAYWYNRLSLNAADINFAPPLQRRYASTHR